jgi:formylglycine-generating enzyme required for sulfatase activity
MLCGLAACKGSLPVDDPDDDAASYPGNQESSQAVNSAEAGNDASAGENSSEAEQSGSTPGASDISSAGTSSAAVSASSMGASNSGEDSSEAEQSGSTSDAAASSAAVGASSADTPGAGENSSEAEQSGSTPDAAASSAPVDASSADTPGAGENSSEAEQSGSTPDEAAASGAPVGASSADTPGAGEDSSEAEQSGSAPGVSSISSASSVGASSIFSIESHVMVLISAGSFSMGSPSTETSKGSDETLHQVTITKNFYIGKYQVTQELYLAVMGENPSTFKTSPASGEVQAKRPVEQVSWYAALVFCNKLSDLEELTPAYTINNSTDTAAWGTVPATDTNATWDAAVINTGANGYRLPTEAEWEYACRAESQSAWNLGTAWSAAWGWYGFYEEGNAEGKTHQVGIKLPNNWGLYDMHGNVFEWCWDWYNFGYYTVPGAETDPLGPDTGTSRISRGGNWQSRSPYDNLRSAFRNQNSPGQKGPTLGFRLARNAE